MIDLQNLYSKFSNTAFSGRLKLPQNKAFTPPSMLCGKINTQNLAPLNADTVSFTGTRLYVKQRHKENIDKLPKKAHYAEESPKEEENFNLYQMSESAQINSEKSDTYDNAAKNMNSGAYSVYKGLLPIAGDVHNQAKNLEGTFRIKMCIFDSLVDETGKSPSGKPIAKKIMRVKSQQSIAKKMSPVVADLIDKNNGYDVHISLGLIKSELHDLLGARLILANGTTAETNAVINRLIESIETGNGPKIKTIKNYGSAHKYLSSSKLEQLEKACYKAYGHFPVTVNKKKTSGYTATHIIIEVGSGIDAEIQILGRGVARVKEIDDICYKGLQGKAISGMPDVTKALKMISKNPELKKEFDKYITSAYEVARTKWDKLPDNQMRTQKFPPIDTKIFPPCLDFNNIEASMLNKTSNKSVKSSKNKF